MPSLYSLKINQRREEDKMEIKEKLAQFFEEEKIFVEDLLLFETDNERRNKILMKSKQRAYGAVELAVLCGLDTDTAEKMFYDYYDGLTGETK
jgi:hypothetical protein